MTPLIFPVSAVSWKAVVFIVIMASLPGVLTYAGVKSAGGNGLPMAAIVSALALPLFAFLLAQLYLVKIVVEPHRLRVGGGLYQVNVPISALKLDQLRVSTRSSDSPALHLRTNGIGMPGLNLGWFKVSRRKVFAAVGRVEKLIVIPTELDYDLVVAPTDTDGFLKALEGTAARKSELEPTH